VGCRDNDARWFVRVK